MRIIDVDFKSKRLNFTYDDLPSPEKTNAHKDLYASLVTAYNQVLTLKPHDKKYQEWCDRIFTEIVRNTKEEL